MPTCVSFDITAGYASLLARLDRANDCPRYAFPALIKAAAEQAEVLEAAIEAHDPDSLVTVDTLLCQHSATPRQVMAVAALSRLEPVAADVFAVALRVLPQDVRMAAAHHLSVALRVLRHLPLE